MRQVLSFPLQSPPSPAPNHPRIRIILAFIPRPTQAQGVLGRQRRHRSRTARILRLALLPMVPRSPSPYIPERRRDIALRAICNDFDKRVDIDDVAVEECVSAHERCGRPR